MARHQAGDLAAAAGLYRRHLEQRPEDVAAWCLLASAEGQAGHHAGAGEAYRRAVEISPDHAPAHAGLGTSSLQQGNFEEAAGHLRRAVELDPEQVDARLQLAMVLRRQVRLPEATAELEEVLRRQPGHAQARFNLGMASLEGGRAEAAEDAFRKVLEARPRLVPALVGLARALRARNRPDAARVPLAEARALAPGDPAVAVARGGLLVTCGELAAAREAFEEALAADPGQTAALLGLAELDRLAGHCDRGIERLAPLLAGPAPGGVAVLMGRLLREAGRADEAERFIRRQLDGEALMPGARAALERELGRVLDARGDVDGAWAAWTAANAGRAGRFDPAHFDRAVDMLIDSFRPAGPPPVPLPEPDAPLSLLIVGAPRSGKSLLEQMLACHPDVHGGGERRTLGDLVVEVGQRVPDGTYPANVGKLEPGALAELAATYAADLKQAAAGARWVIDTQPTNFLHVGLARLLYPGLRVVWLRRDPRDLAWACYARGFADSAFDFAAEPAGIGPYFAALDRLRAHWATLLGDGFLSVDYEALVRQPQVELGRVFAWLGLAPDAMDADFHLPGRSSLSSPPALTRPLDGGEIGRGRAYAERFPGLPAARSGDVGD
jgi:tetratricopeptide (TPR) repeat protein